jgi:protein-L-isoaspartate(D-aspartate) O-methyltransferase
MSVLNPYLLVIMLSFLAGLGLCASCSAEPAGKKNGEAAMESRRSAMVTTLKRYGIKSDRVLSAMQAVRRHAYVPEVQRDRCDPYGDHPCPIGYKQTISQPFIVAYMTEHMRIQEGEKVLEIGTGSGYQAAILAELKAEVLSIEIVPELAEHAKRVLAAEGYKDVKVLAGDGYKGWPEHAPFDAIIVTCAPESLPEALVKQLKDGGRMILPLGGKIQRLVILKNEGGKMQRQDDIMVRFVPMVHEKDRESRSAK